jgi:hypothetical protein
MRKNWKAILGVLLIPISHAVWFLDQIGRAQTVSALPILGWIFSPYFSPIAFTAAVGLCGWAYWDLAIRKHPAGFIGMPAERSKLAWKVGGIVAAVIVLLVVAPLIYGHYHHTTISTASSSPVKSITNSHSDTNNAGTASTAVKDDAAAKQPDNTRKTSAKRQGKPATKSPPTQQAVTRESLPKEPVPSVDTPQPRPPTMSQECAPGSQCAMSSGQQGGFTGQVTVVNMGRIITPLKYDAFVQHLTGSEKTSVAIVGFEPITQEIERITRQIKGAFLDGGWGDVPANKADIRNVHNVFYINNDRLINEPEGMHCVGDGVVFSHIVQWLSEAGLECKISPAALYPPAYPVPAAITIYIGRDLQ